MIRWDFPDQNFSLVEGMGFAVVLRLGIHRLLSTTTSRGSASGGNAIEHLRPSAEEVVSGGVVDTRFQIAKNDPDRMGLGQYIGDLRRATRYRVDFLR